MRDRRPSLLLGSLVLGTAVVLASTAGAVAGSMITGKQIKDGTVTSKDIKDRTLRAQDLAPDTIAQLTGAPGATGATGATGAAGVAGAPGAPGVAGPPGAADAADYQVVTEQQTGVADGGNATVLAHCPAGKLAIGGGASWAGGPNIALSTIGGSGPLLALRDGDGNVTGNASPSTTAADMWSARGVNHAGGPRSFVVYVICAEIG